jgi:hypothetical protein
MSDIDIVAAGLSDQLEMALVIARDQSVRSSGPWRNRMGTAEYIGGSGRCAGAGSD